LNCYPAKSYRGRDEVLRAGDVPGKIDDYKAATEFAGF
jgi:hypothetical protein